LGFALVGGAPGGGPPIDRIVTHRSLEGSVS
jgi:hypothetical protein